MPFERIKRSVLIKKETETSEKFGNWPSKRSTKELMHYGIINIDKPKGPTSHQVADYVKKILKVQKSGHSGTLDPGVTGVLPVALDKATRVSFFLLSSGKEYVCLMHLHDDVTDEKLNDVIAQMTGKIKQTPPLKSAVKRQERERTVYYIEILDRIDREVLFLMGCQAGTYVRKWVHDLGKMLGSGAHMAELRRTKAGFFNEDSLCTLQDVNDAYYYYTQGNDRYLRSLIQPVEKAVQHLPKVWVFDTTVDSLCHGAYLALPGVSKFETDIEIGQQVAIMTLKDELICVGRSNMASKQMLQADKGLAVKTEAVFMDPGVYPRMQK